MSLTSRLRTGLAALALTLTTSALALTTPALAYQPPADRPSQTGAQDLIYTLRYWDVAVKFKAAAFRPTQFGNGEDVAFEIQNLGDTVAYPNIKLTATCNYKTWSTNASAGSETLPTTSMGMVKGAIPAPYLVSCPIKNSASVSSVSLTAEVKGDMKTVNNTAYWERYTGGHSN